MRFSTRKLVSRVSFALALTSVFGATSACAQSLSLTDATYNEGDSGTFQATIQLELSAPVSSPVTVHLATANGTAAAGSDYVAVDTTVTIPANSIRKAITITVNSDTLAEPDENFFVNISNAVNATISDSQAMITLLSDDADLSVDDVSVVEGNGGSQNLVFAVSLSNVTSKTVTFDAATVDGTAFSGGSPSVGADFAATSGTNFAIFPGQTKQYFSVSAYGDKVVEGDETFQFRVSNVANAAVVDGTAVGTIVNDDTGPATLSVNSLAIAEGDSGQKVLTFTVQLSAPQPGPVSFDISTADGTATAGTDYVAKSQLGMQIAAGALTQSFSVVVNGDTEYESDESFNVNLSNATGAVLGYPHGVGKIVNDDLVPLLLSVEQAFTGEGSNGWYQDSFAVQLSRPTDVDVSFDIETSDGTATAGSDYLYAKSVGMVIPAGQTLAFFHVQINGDKAKEPDETFYATLSNVHNSPVSGTPGSLTLWNDDQGGPLLTVADESVTEGDSGTKDIVFHVSLSEASADPISLTYSAGFGTAQVTQDYVGGSQSTLQIPAGATSATFSFQVVGDTVGEPDEYFYVSLLSATNATIGNTSDPRGFIINDDPVPSISIGDVSVTEGDLQWSQSATFTVQLSQPSASQVFFDISTVNGTATSGEDFFASPGSMTIQPGETSATFTVSINGDTTAEPDETFVVALANVNGATVADGQAIGTIVNDDAALGPTLSVGDVSVSEGNSSTKTANFTITLSSAQAGPVLVDVATANGTATAGSDYVAKTTAALRIPAGAISKTFAVTINGDTTVESDETFTVNLSNASGATIADGAGVGTITNDDGSGQPSLSIGDVSTAEGNSGTKIATFTVSLSAPSSSAVSFDFATANGSATAGSDYVAVSLAGQSIASGATSKTFAVTINGDTTVEPDETFAVNVINVSGASVADGSAVGTITNDDAGSGPTLSVGDISIAEGNSGTKSATFTVSLSAAQSGPVQVDVATANGTATAGSDYVAKSTTGLRIAAGATSKTFVVTINGDTTAEPDETFTVNLSNPTGATIADGQAVGTISNDDAAATPTLSIADASVSEGNSGTKTLTFTVNLSPAASGTVSYDIATSNGTATAGSDYVASTLSSQTLAAGTTSKTFAVTINGDTTTEADETFNVTLSNVSGATLGDGTAVGTITNDDAATGGPTLSIGDVTVVEGNSLQKQVSFTVTLSAPASTAVTYNIATANGTATAPTDYVAKSLTGQSIAAGATSKTFTVAVKGDTVVEPNETFVVNVTGVVGATVADGQATGTITNDDGAALTVARFDARGLFDDVDDGHREPVLGSNEYALLLLDTAQQLCRRTGVATVVAVEDVESRSVLAELADAANASCADKPRYDVAMAEGDSRGFLVQVGTVVQGSPEVSIAADATSIRVLGAGQSQPIRILLAGRPPAGPSIAQSRALAQQLQAMRGVPLVLLGASAVNGMLDLSLRARPTPTDATPLPADRVLVNAALLREYAGARAQFLVLPVTEAPAQLLDLR